MTVDEALEKVEDLRKLKKNNPQWERFFMAGYKTALDKITVQDSENPPLPSHIVSEEYVRITQELLVLKDLFEMLEDREHQGNLWWFREWKRKNNIEGETWNNRQ